MGKKKKNDVIYDKNVNYDELEQHEYDDAKGYTFYTCPKCGGEYLATFISYYFYTMSSIFSSNVL